jgi:hypothetical protein
MRGGVSRVSQRVPDTGVVGVSRVSPPFRGDADTDTGGWTPPTQGTRDTAAHRVQPPPGGCLSGGGGVPPVRRPLLAVVGKARLILSEELPDVDVRLALYVLDQADELARTRRGTWPAPRDRTQRVTVALAVVLLRLQGRLSLGRFGVPAPRAVDALRAALGEMEAAQ